MIIKSAPFHFQIDLVPVGQGRKIRGVISTPHEDLEKEVIEPSALRKALSNFMKHPILHLLHTERPVGLVTSAVVKKSGETEIEGEIFSTDDTDDVWEDIRLKKLTKFSIFGRRKYSDGPCHVSPSRRAAPCITKSLDLWSISIVGSTAINQNTYLEIAKANLDETDQPVFAENLALIYKSADLINESESGTMVPEPKDKKDEAEGDAPIIKSDEGGADDRLDKIEKSLGVIAGSIEAIIKSLPAKTDEPPKEDPPIEKANLDIGPIVKAQVEEAVGDIRKSFDGLSAQVTKLLEEFEEVKSTVIRKSGPIVFIPQDGEDENDMLSNAAAVGGL